MDTVNKKSDGANTNDMGTSTSVFGKKARTPMGATDTGEAPVGNLEKRPRGDVLEMAVAADLGVVKSHAQ